MKKFFEIAANGTPIGSYEGATAEAAVLAYVRDAGYRDVAHAAEVLGQTDREFLEEIDVQEAA